MSRSADAAGPAPDMIPGEILTRPGEIILNENADCLTIEVVNTGDRPIQVGSHYHFAETNPALRFDRGLARGRRLDVPSGGALRFEPGQTREVVLIPFGGARRVIGFRSEIMGDLD